VLVLGEWHIQGLAKRSENTVSELLAIGCRASGSTVFNVVSDFHQTPSLPVDMLLTKFTHLANPILVNRTMPQLGDFDYLFKNRNS
jgi:hypothetical protein